MKKNGYTLIELMIVVAIIGMLSMIAIPAYQDYVTRTRVSEALSLAGTYKSSIVENLGNNGENRCISNRSANYPNDEVFDSSLAAPLEYATSRVHAMIFGKSNLGTGTCGIWIQFNNNNPRGVARQYIVLRMAQQDTLINGKAQIKEGSINWVCETRIPRRYLPKECTYKGDVFVTYSGSLPHEPL